MKTAIIGDSDGRYFMGWCAMSTPKYESDDESYIIIPSFVCDVKNAKVFDSEAHANRTLKNIVGRHHVRCAIIS
jgi:hypothetical protein